MTRLEEQQKGGGIKKKENGKERKALPALPAVYLMEADFLK